MDVNAVLHSFHPTVQPYIKEVLYSGKVGMFILPVRLLCSVTGTLESKCNAPHI